MTRHTIGVALSREYPKCKSHLLQHPLAVRGKCWMLRYSWQANPLGDQFQRALRLLGFSIFACRQVELYSRNRGRFDGFR